MDDFSIDASGDFRLIEARDLVAAEIRASLAATRNLAPTLSPQALTIVQRAVEDVLSRLIEPQNPSDHLDVQVSQNQEQARELTVSILLITEFGRQWMMAVQSKEQEDKNACQ